MGNIYKENGYTDRMDYLECLAAEYDAPLDIVIQLAKFLGPSEDFDGLIAEVQDLGVFF